MDLDAERLEEALETLGALLADRNQPFDLVAVGGSSLMLLGLLIRPTRDIDVIAIVRNDAYRPADPLPVELSDAVVEVATALGLAPDWLNAGPASLLDFGLPAGFSERVHTRTYSALTLRIADRFDQICFKTYASVDQGPTSKHFTDLRGLEPSDDELLQATRWAMTHDPSEAFRGEGLKLLEQMGVTDAEQRL